MKTKVIAFTVVVACLCIPFAMRDQGVAVASPSVEVPVAESPGDCCPAGGCNCCENCKCCGDCGGVAAAALTVGDTRVTDQGVEQRLIKVEEVNGVVYRHWLNLSSPVNCENGVCLPSSGQVIYQTTNGQQGVSSQSACEGGVCPTPQRRTWWYGR